MRPKSPIKVLTKGDTPFNRALAVEFPSLSPAVTLVFVPRRMSFSHSQTMFLVCAINKALRTHDYLYPLGAVKVVPCIEDGAAMSFSDRRQVV